MCFCLLNTTKLKRWIEIPMSCGAIHKTHLHSCRTSFGLWFSKFFHCWTLVPNSYIMLTMMEMSSIYPLSLFSGCLEGFLLYFIFMFFIGLCFPKDGVEAYWLLYEMKRQNKRNFWYPPFPLQNVFILGGWYRIMNSSWIVLGELIKSFSMNLVMWFWHRIFLSFERCLVPKYFIYFIEN